ncbi:MAG: TonB-dependent receptor [Calditrichaeota bacterium]|nr:MAG: TonB-dependent receptor [Calditrichota bacterium]
MLKRILISFVGVLLFFACLFITQTYLFAQTGTIQGKVTDKETGDPLPGANVVVQSAEIQTGAASRSDGTYEVRHLPAGTYTITVTFIGYKEESTTVTVTAGKTVTMDFQLTATGIMANPIAVTASRRPEKILEAPADVVVLEVRQIETRPVLTVAEHLKSAPGVDMVTSGLNQSNVVVRGFNNVFSGALLSLVDNRIARVPSLRLNAYQFIPTVNEDIERIELVLGPGSALYGPNSASGVLHIITKSPFTSQGTTASIGGGERSVFMASFRHASVLNDHIGFKISAQYYQGNDWKFFDPAEPDTIIFGRQTSQGRVNIDGPVPNRRDFDVEKLAGEARVDFKLSDDATIIVNGGFNRGSNIELTGIGAAQAKDWTYSYGQVRFLYKNLFIQGFINASDAGDTYLLRTGDLIVDNSKLFVFQAQHGLTLGNRQRFTYGFDALLTRPNTDNTINGRNEDNDDINEFGGYLQSETDISSKLKFVGAARLDKHSELEDVIFSPRAALVFKPMPTQNFRVTYNRAYSTPSTNNLFLDILSVRDVFGLGKAFQPALGFSPSTDIRAQGVPSTGFNFVRDDMGLPMFRSPFAPVAGLTPSDFIPLNDPVFTNVMWGIARQAILAGFVPQFQALLAQQGLPQAQIDALTQAFVNIVPQQVSGVKNVLRVLNTTTGTFEDVSDVTNVPRMKQTTTQTFEFGYKGVIADKLALGFDVYHSDIDDFIGPLIVETPNVFLDGQTLAASLAQQFGQALSDPNNAILNAILINLDNPQFGGNGNGSAVDELTNLFVLGPENNGAAFIPFGTVSPKEAFDPTALILTYRNFGNISVNGIDFHFSYFVNRNWTFGGNFSWVSKDFFKKGPNQPQDIALNAPKFKFGGYVDYHNTQLGLSGNLRLRFVDDFPVNSGVFIGRVDSYAVLDLTLAYKLPFSRGTQINLTIQNLTDNKHREIVGAPEIGRLAILRLSQSL